MGRGTAGRRPVVEGARNPPPSAACGVCHLPIPVRETGRILRDHHSSQPVGDMYGSTMPIASISCIWPPQTL
jgi:hypothetical protein